MPVPAQLPYAELCNRRLLHAQGAYQHEWVYNNLERSSQVSPNSRSGRKDAPTKASLGHQMGAQAVLAGPPPEDVWKMSKFQKVDSKVKALMGKQ